MALKAHFYIVMGDLRITKFMQAADMFEKDKVIGEIVKFYVEFKEEEKRITFARCERLIEKMAELFPKKYIVSLIHLDYIEEGDVIRLNREGKCAPYINKSVRVISDGHNWYMFHELLKKLKINFELDEHCFVK